MCNIQRLRSIPECIAWLKEQDPGTRITSAMLREIAASGDVSCVWRGRKVLIDIDALPEAISTWVEKQTQRQKECCKAEVTEIKPVSSRYGRVRAI